jgi:hypothetical protein
LRLPHCPIEDDGGHGYVIDTLAEKLVCDYARISFFDVGQLRVDDYKSLLRDAYIHRLNSTESGREHLEKCWILEQTKPDRQKLRKKFGKRE